VPPLSRTQPWGARSRSCSRGRERGSTARPADGLGHVAEVWKLNSAKWLTSIPKSLLSTWINRFGLPLLNAALIRVVP